MPLFIFPCSTASNQKPRSPSRHAYSQQRRRRSRHSVLGHRNASSTHAVAWNQSRPRRVCPTPPSPTAFQRHTFGPLTHSYWTMHFDASPEKQKGLSKLLRKDPRVVRATVLKLGERIEDVAWKYPKTIIPARDVPGIP